VDAPLALPAQYSRADSWVTGQPADRESRGSWWERFNDPELNQLQQSLGQDNSSLRVSLARLEAARAAAQAAASALWPRVGMNVTHLRSRTSSESPNYSANRVNPVDDYNASATLSYELDLFGRIQSSATSARALAAAAESDNLTLELSVRTELIVVYYQLRAMDSQREVLSESLATQEKALEILRHQRDAGTATPGDVALLQSQVEAVRTQLADTLLRRAQTEHAMAVMLGRAPSEWRQPPMPLERTVALPRVSPGQPSTLLQRRPDIAAAQRRVESASAQLGLAKRAYFPIFSLGASLGRDSAHADRWFEAPARFWSLAPNVALTLLDGGQRRAQTRSATAALLEATENYRHTLLTANQEVEDQMAAVQILTDAAQSASQSVSAALVSRGQSMHRLTEGAATTLDVAVTQTALLNARLAEIAIQQRRIAATALLVRALGGYWE
jgi:NodT family efflux transporter outer membrane factor (OMF) lipoprotein